MGRNIDDWNPLVVRDVNIAHEREAISAESVTFVTGATGFSQVVALDKGSITSLAGDKIGSYWRKSKNLRLSNGPRASGARATLDSVVETAGSAACVITDPDYNLEQLFETPSGTKAYVLVIRDAGGDVLYGHIGGVSASGNAYTVSVFSTAVGSTQDWVGTLGDFTYATGASFEIYSYETSLAWVTGTILTREVEYREGVEDSDQLDAMANGDYAVEYSSGRILYKKATTGTSDTVNYSVLKPYISVTLGASPDVNIGDIQQDAASTTSSGTVAADTTAGGTQIVAANANRYFTQCQNNGSVDVYYGTGTVTSSFLKVVAGGTWAWHSQEALKVLSSSGSANIAFTDYLNS